MSLERIRAGRWHTGVLGLCLLVYLALSFDQLTVFPIVGQDQGWNTEAPYKLATEGTYGSDLFAGYDGLERHYYQQMPLFFLLEAGVFKIAGAGVFQMRFLSVLFGALLLAVTYAVGRQLRGARTGVVAVVLLIGLRPADRYGTSGIPLLDIARVNRYDMPVPVWGLLAWCAFVRAEGKGDLRRTLLSGALAGLASLSHLYGAFWLLVLWAFLLLRYGPLALKRREPYLLLAGFVLVWLPWLFYIASGWQDYLGQNRLYSDRFDLLNPGFYLDNLLHEPERYRSLALFNGAGRPDAPRPGAWTAVLGLPASLVALVYHGKRRADRWCLNLAAGLILQGLLFAVLIKLKFYNYVIALWPLATLALAWLGAYLWDQWPRRSTRLALAGLLTLILLEGSLGIVEWRQVASQTTPYVQFEARIAALIPAGARVLGLETYWPGLRAYPYRTWLLPWFQSDAALYQPPLPLDQALEQVDPDVILLDSAMIRVFLDAANPSSPRHAHYQQFQAYMSHHQAILAGVVLDAAYGRVEVYRLDGPASGP